MMKTQITDPKRYLLRMIIILLVTFGILALLYQPLYAAFMGNAVLNGVIIATALIGVAFIFRQTLRLVPEARWLNTVKTTHTLSRSAPRPVLLATVHAMLSASHEEQHLSALSLRSVLDGVAARLDEGREISRYFIGLMVFLGLLGTFWGLLQTIGSVSAVVGGLDMTSLDFDQLMSQLREGLDAPLSGMATAFSSSLFGLGASLVLGFLDLQLGQAMGRFFNEVEDWLSAFARFGDSNGTGAGNQMLAQGLSEEGARAMIALSRAIEQAEAGRASHHSQLTQLNSQLAILNENLAQDARLTEHLSHLTTRLEMLQQSLETQSKQQNSAISSELKALSSAIVKLVANK
jgi:hypothetical protein